MEKKNVQCIINWFAKISKNPEIKCLAINSINIVIVNGTGSYRVQRLTMLVNTAIVSNSSVGFQPWLFLSLCVCVVVLVFLFLIRDEPCYRRCSRKISFEQKSEVLFFFLLKTHTYELQILERKVSCSRVGRTCL